MRHLHISITKPPTPAPTTQVPDVTTFLTKIGRNCQVHAAKFTEWATLFDATSTQLKELGIEPSRTRRYIIRWRETYRRNNGKVKLHEQKRGVKIDGGERRQKEVRAKRFAEERRIAEGRER